jgi:hypothetical protein
MLLLAGLASTLICHCRLGRPPALYGCMSNGSWPRIPFLSFYTWAGLGWWENDTGMQPWVALTKETGKRDNARMADDGGRPVSIV